VISSACDRRAVEPETAQDTPAIGTGHIGLAVCCCLATITEGCPSYSPIGAVATIGQLRVKSLSRSGCRHGAMTASIASDKVPAFNSLESNCADSSLPATSSASLTSCALPPGNHR
jgi:hypothetical protein